MDKKLADFFCDPKTAVKNIALLALMLFAIIYAFFQLMPSFSAELNTETTLEVKVFDANVTTGYIFRSEEPIVSAAGNDRVVVTLIKDGERVSKGQHFANAYFASDYAEIQEKIDLIDDKIRVLEKSSVETNSYVTDLSKTDGEIKKGFDKIYSSVSDGNLLGLNSVENELLVNMNKRNLIVNMSESYTTEIQNLTAQRNNLENRVSAYSDRVVAANSGYYYGDNDGFERIFDVNKLNGLTHDSFRQIINTKPEEDVLKSNYGKIVNDYVWYTVCESDKTAAAKYEMNRYYNLVFPTFSDDELRLKLIDIVKSTSEDTVLLVFRGNTAPEGFPYSRCQQVNIISGEYSGYAVPKDAVRQKDNIKGVYILTGDIVRFRRIDIISEDGDYYIVRIPKASELVSNGKEDVAGSVKYLSLYDSIIIGGKELFDGKIVG